MSGCKGLKILLLRLHFAHSWTFYSASNAKSTNTYFVLNKSDCLKIYQEYFSFLYPNISMHIFLIISLDISLSANKENLYNNKEFH